MDKIKTLRERFLEEQQRQAEGGIEQRFKKRLIRVSIGTKPLTVLHRLQIFYCGYCGQPIALFSVRPVQMSEKLPPLYYSCRDRCKNVGFHRAEFIDRLLLQLIQKRITENFPEPKKKGDYEKMLEKFSKLEQLRSKRLKLLGKMHYSSYKRDKVLAEITSIKEEIAKMENEIASLFSAGVEENPLMFPLFNTPPDRINQLDLEYRRELVKITTRRLRFFNEFIIVRMYPLTDEDKAKSDEMGRVFNINLRITDRGKKIELPDINEQKKEDETQAD